MMEPPDMDPMTGNEGFVQPSCGAPVAPITGPLCGPSSAPCRQIAEHTFDQLDAEASVSLAFAGGAVHVLQEKAVAAYLAPAVDGSRANPELVPGPTMRASYPPIVSLAIDGEGVALALLHGGLPGTTELWRRGAGAGGWAFDSRVQADLAHRHDLHAGVDCLHAALLLDYTVSSESDNHPVYAVYDGHWQEFVLGPRTLLSAGPPALALDAAGTAHVVYWRASGRGYSLYYAIPGRLLETVGATGSATPEGVQHRPGSPRVALTADTDGETVVHIARALFDQNLDAEMIVLATREAGTWTEREVVRWAPGSGERVELHALFASATGDLRLFIERHDLASDAKGELLIGWPERGGIAFARYDGPVPSAVSPEGHFWAQQRPALGENLTLAEHGP